MTTIVPRAHAAHAPAMRRATLPAPRPAHDPLPPHAGDLPPLADILRALTAFPSVVVDIPATEACLALTDKGEKAARALLLDADSMRFSLTPKGQAALTGCVIVPGCPDCGAPLERITDFGADFYECSTVGCFTTISAREMEAVQ